MREQISDIVGYIAAAAAVVLVFNFMMAGCENYNEGQQETKRICIENGGSWTVNGDCISNKNK